jgi:hypothetical protein
LALRADRKLDEVNSHRLTGLLDAGKVIPDVRVNSRGDASVHPESLHVQALARTAA